jgi:hypothetical protein
MDQAHEEAIKELMVGMEASTSDALQLLQRQHVALAAELEAARAAHASELEAVRREAAEQQNSNKAVVKHSQGSDIFGTPTVDAANYDEKLRALERERDEAVRAAEDAEDRIESMKGEVVRKHLARVEPLEKENALLTDKIDRLEAIIAAGDRIARAAATVGEKRTINTLAEEEEDADEDTVLGAQVSNSNGAVDHNDVVGTVS